MPKILPTAFTTQEFRVNESKKNVINSKSNTKDLCDF